MGCRELRLDFSRGDASFTISYLTNSCGLSLKDAFFVSAKLCIKSRENSDTILQLLKRYGFTNAQISRLVRKWPGVLQSRADKTISPKLEFFCSIGVPPAALPQKLSEYPFLMRRSFDNYFTPWYKYLKSNVQSDKNVVAVFLSSPRAFTHGWPERIHSNIGILRERGVPESSITLLIVNKPSMMILKQDKFGACVDWAAELGLAPSKVVFVRTLQVFGRLSESTVKHKMGVYRRCGWSECDLNVKCCIFKNTYYSLCPRKSVPFGCGHSHTSRA
ncbi:uncharacterized protein LOC130990403 [Salvia miltiorrhiza]|uniref:uncharacterized protein LOC130990403 n=1 Tax=Salvia miltiorrhiza TaxID=226208 RepID=UPI0025ACEE70|nr:uncharacterized protein LOC130990403 [Salvia miltiorrhiza]